MPTKQADLGTSRGEESIVAQRNLYVSFLRYVLSRVMK